jgi:hypothetical protein
VDPVLPVNASVDPGNAREISLIKGGILEFPDIGIGIPISKHERNLQ